MSGASRWPREMKIYCAPMAGENTSNGPDETRGMRSAAPQACKKGTALATHFVFGVMVLVDSGNEVEGYARNEVDEAIAGEDVVPAEAERRSERSRRKRETARVSFAGGKVLLRSWQRRPLLSDGSLWPIRGAAAVAVAARGAWLDLTPRHFARLTIALCFEIHLPASGS